jgi:hypothetical protein
MILKPLSCRRLKGENETCRTSALGHKGRHEPGPSSIPVAGGNAAKEGWMRVRSLWLSIAGCLVLGAGFGAAGTAVPPSVLEPIRGLDEIATGRLAELDFTEIDLEDRKRLEEGLAPRYAAPVTTRIVPNMRTGSWDTLADGRMVWRMKFQAPDALSLNFGFGEFHLPPTAELWIYSPDLGQVLGPFTDRDNDRHRQFWSPLILGEEAVIELAIRPEFLQNLELTLAQIGHGYTGFGYPIGADRSGSCNLDVICGDADGFPEVDLWRDQIRSVAVISTGGSTFCTGFLVNSTHAEVQGFFMTADHCGISSGNAASLVTYWNYENSTCRQPGSSSSGQSGDGTLNEFNTGSTFRAGRSASDFTLVQLDDPINPDFDPYFAGWDNTGVESSGAIAIHHPATDEKRISFEDEATTTTSYLGTSVPGDGTHVRVEDWDLGTTEGGSSGSPLFDVGQRVIGQLHGGYAACGNDDSDWYGRFSVSWDAGATAAARLKDWLDPGDTGATKIDGRDLCVPPTFDFTISANPATPGQVVTFDATSVSGTGPFEFAWDFDGDMVADCATDPCNHTYSAYFNSNVTLWVTDQGENCVGTLSKAMVVNASSIEYASTGTPYELCGDGDAVIEPGEEWAVPVTLTNSGNQVGSAIQATVEVEGDPDTVVLTHDQMEVASIAVGADEVSEFSFGVMPGFQPCGAAIQFNMGSISWTGGSNPGHAGMYTAATGGGTGTQVAFEEDFEDGATWLGLGDPGAVTDRWVVTTEPGHTAGEWARAADGAQGQPANSTGYFAVADSDDAGSGEQTSTTLFSPVVDLSGVLSGTVSLDLDLYYNYYSSGGSEHAEIDAWDGLAWQNVASFTATDVNDHRSYDVSAHAHGNPDFRIRFTYLDASFDWYFAIDNLQIIIPVTPVCDNSVNCEFTGAIFADGFESGGMSNWSSRTP